MYVCVCVLLISKQSSTFFPQVPQASLKPLPVTLTAKSMEKDFIPDLSARLPYSYKIINLRPRRPSDVIESSS